MTIIEFFDKTAIDNIAGALLCKPQRVVFVGAEAAKKAEMRLDQYRAILKKRGLQTKLLYRAVPQNDIQSICDTLAKLVEENGECAFDLTGGDELYLVAVGSMMERFGSRVQCHRFHFQTQELRDCDGDGDVCATDAFSLSVEENIRIYGGIPQRMGEGYCSDHVIDDAFLHDIEVMWEICRKNAKEWNSQVGTFGRLEDFCRSCVGLKRTFAKSEWENFFRRQKVKWYSRIVRELVGAGLLCQVSADNGFSYTFKNAQIKKCLTVAGQVLEQLVAIRMRALVDTDGTSLYQDIRVGVIIDWNQPNTARTHTVNEIDVMAMKGMIPIFISCKNGNFDVEELYKLNTVACRFGSKYAKKAIIATELDKLGGKEKYIRARAEDMGIYLIRNADELSAKDLDQKLKHLWRT